MTLWELLADQQIRLKRLDPGHTEHLDCPRCGGGAHRDKGSLSVTIDSDGMGAAWVCHRGTCGWTEGVRVKPANAGAAVRLDRPKPKGAQGYTPRSLDAVLARGSRPEWLNQFFDDRRIGEATVQAFGVTALEWSFPGLGQSRAVAFPYVFGDQVVAIKFRPDPAKSPQSQVGSGVAVLFNADSLRSARTCVWAEGEPDVMALHEAIPSDDRIYTAIVSLKDGAPSDARFKPDDARFAALQTHAKALAKIDTHILAGDMDTPGLALREELAARLGRHKCRLVTWPQGCKDACDVLALRNEEGELVGVQSIRDAIHAAKPYPIEGLQQVTGTTLEEYLADPAPQTMTTGVHAVDCKLHLPADGALIVVTGLPTHGKTSWMRHVMVHTARTHARKWLVFSPEQQPWKRFIAYAAHTYLGKRLRSSDPNTPIASIMDRMDATNFLMAHVYMAVCDAERSPTLDWILDLAMATRTSFGITDLLIDPWNELEHNRGEMSETDYIGRSLQRLKAFALRYGVNVWVVAHPSKPMMMGAPKEPPAAYAISGSAHWANKTDFGLTVWLDKGNNVELHCWKSRYADVWGRAGQWSRMDYRPDWGRYTEPPQDAEDESRNVPK
jgi:twinkle protein